MTSILRPLVVACLLLSPALAAEPPRAWPAEAFLPLTPERIATLPVAEQPAWRVYWQQSLDRSKLAGPRQLAERTSMRRLDGPPIPSTYSKGVRLNAASAWYATEEARTIADQVVNWQTPTGGWTKGGDYSRPRQPADDHHDAWSAGTFDNDSTLYELRFLALVNAAAPPDARATPRAQVWRDSFLRGLDYTLAAQYPNGGFPQIYPLVGGYHDAVTFNDDAMVHILELLRDLALRRPEFAFVPAEKTAQARRALELGVQCILASQITTAGGQHTVWGAQHDPLTLRPCAARNFEPVAECSNESVGLVLFLMSAPPAPKVVAAVEDAVAWFRRHALHGVVWNRDATTGTGLEPRDGAPDLWARFYELGTGRPIFGERDRMVHYTVTELTLERRKGYGWYNSRASSLFPAHEAWRQTAPVAR